MGVIAAESPQQLLKRLDGNSVRVAELPQEEQEDVAHACIEVLAAEAKTYDERKPQWIAIRFLRQLAEAGASTAKSYSTAAERFSDDRGDVVQNAIYLSCLTEQERDAAISRGLVPACIDHSDSNVRVAAITALNGTKDESVQSRVIRRIPTGSASESRACIDFLLECDLTTAVDTALKKLTEEKWIILVVEALMPPSKPEKAATPNPWLANRLMEAIKDRWTLHFLVREKCSKLLSLQLSPEQQTELAKLVISCAKDLRPDQCTNSRTSALKPFLDVLDPVAENVPYFLAAARFKGEYYWGWGTTNAALERLIATGDALSLLEIANEEIETDRLEEGKKLITKLLHAIKQDQSLDETSQEVVLSMLPKLRNQKCWELIEFLIQRGFLPQNDQRVVQELVYCSCTLKKAKQSSSVRSAHAAVGEFLGKCDPTSVIAALMP